MSFKNDGGHPPVAHPVGAENVIAVVKELYL